MHAAWLALPPPAFCTGSLTKAQPKRTACQWAGPRSMRAAAFAAGLPCAVRTAHRWVLSALCPLRMPPEAGVRRRGRRAPRRAACLKAGGRRRRPAATRMPPASGRAMQKHGFCPARGGAYHKYSGTAAPCRHYLLSKEELQTQL